jgi:hypothetical protein
VLATVAAPLAGAAPGEIIEGGYKLVGQNGTQLDHWDISPRCSQPTIDCLADISSQVGVNGTAHYRGATTGIWRLKATCQSAPMVARLWVGWPSTGDSKKLIGTVLTAAYRSCHDGSNPSKTIPFKLVKD